MRHVVQAVRSLRRSRGFTAIAITSLGIALGVTTAVFSLVDAVRHPQSMFADPDRLYAIAGAGDGAARDVRAGDRVRALEGRLPSTTGTAYTSYYYFGGATNGSKSLRVTAAGVSGNFFDIAGARPYLGRLFNPARAGDDVGRSVVIDFRLWRSLFNSDARLDRLSLTLGVRTFQVVGVLPPVLGGEMSDNVYVAMPGDVLDRPDEWPYVSLVTRLKAGASYADLAGELHRTAAYMTSVHGTGRNEFRYAARSFRPDPLSLGEMHWLLLAAAGSILLIACANLANLVLARGLMRQRDMALRMSLGARRRDIVREILAECAVVALAGAAVGLVVGLGALQILHTRLPDRLPFFGYIDPSMSWRVAATAGALALVSAGLFGTLPALRLSDLRLTERLADNAGSTTARSHGRYSLVVVGQLALALSLLTGAGLLVRAAARVHDFDFGFDPRQLVQVTVQRARYFGARERAADTSTAATQSFLQGAQDRLSRIAGVEDLAWMNGEATDSDNVTAELPSGGTRSEFTKRVLVASPNLLRTMAVPIVAGRDFEASDAAGDGSAIIDEMMAERLFHQDNPIGRMIKTGTFGSSRPWLRVVGVAKHVRLYLPSELTADDDALVFVTRSVAPKARSFILRAAPSNQPEIELSAQRALRDLTGTGGAFAIAPWSAQSTNVIRTQDFVSRLFVGLGAVALFVCALGLYSVLSYAVNQRTREYGIRMAIGARRSDIFRFVLREGVVLVLAGTALGAFTSMWTNTLIDHFTYDLFHVDPVVLVASEAVLVLVALAAIVAPAVRATRADPVDVLRSV